MNLNLAVLIDGDNIPSAHVKEMMEEIAKYGNPTIKRIYGDWTKSTDCQNGKMYLLRKCHYTYSTIQHTQRVKTPTDSAMIIDAMDLLYTDKVNGFCLGFKRQ